MRITKYLCVNFKTPEHILENKERLVKALPKNEFFKEKGHINY